MTTQPHHMTTQAATSHDQMVPPLQLTWHRCCRSLAWFHLLHLVICVGGLQQGDVPSTRHSKGDIPSITHSHPLVPALHLCTSHLFQSSHPLHSHHSFTVTPTPHPSPITSTLHPSPVTPTPHQSHTRHHSPGPPCPSVHQTCLQSPWQHRSGTRVWRAGPGTPIQRHSGEGGEERRGEGRRGEERGGLRHMGETDLCTKPMNGLL